MRNPNGYCGAVYHSVDMTPDEVRVSAEERMKPYKDRVEWIRKPSPQAFDDVTEPLDFVYIDGDHSYGAVCKDIKASLEHLRTGGLLSGHDAHRRVVRKAVEDTLKGHVISYDRSDWWCVI
jgi:predicted O-methyltransferase YrrM